LRQIADGLRLLAGLARLPLVPEVDGAGRSHARVVQLADLRGAELLEEIAQGEGRRAA
jgi:hypothetical protein